MILIPRLARRKAGGLLAVLVGLAMLWVVPTEAQPLEPLISQPDQHLEALAGTALSPQALSRRDTIAVFWATWSPHCREIVSRALALEGRWGRRARVITVNFQEDPETIRRFLGVDPPTLPIYLDTAGTFARRLGVTTLPTLVIFRGGEAIYLGRLRADADQLIGRFFPEQ